MATFYFASHVARPFAIMESAHVLRNAASEQPANVGVLSGELVVQRFAFVVRVALRCGVSSCHIARWCLCVCSSFALESLLLFGCGARLGFKRFGFGSFQCWTYDVACRTRLHALAFVGRFVVSAHRPTTIHCGILRANRFANCGWLSADDDVVAGALPRFMDSAGAFLPIAAFLATLHAARIATV